MFASISFLIKQLQVAFISNYDICNSIEIFIALNSLHRDFEITTASIVKMKNKSINQIQQILLSAEAKLNSK